MALSRQIAGYLEELVRRGHLGPGSRLPAARALARDLDVNRKTVEAAYGELAARRWVTVRAGRGAVVRGSRPEAPELNLPFRASRARDPLPATAWAPPGPSGSSAADLAGEGPRLRHFPPDVLRRLHAEAVEAGGPLFTPPPPLGEPALRRAGAGLFARCGILRDPDDVGVFRDGADAFARLLDLFVPPGGKVLLDGPPDPRLLPVLEQRMATAVLLGPDAAALDDAGRRGARLILATTGCPRLPEGVPDLARRRALLDLARELGVPVAEDVTGIDRVDAPRLPPLAALDVPGRVFPWFDLDDEIGGEIRAALGAFSAKGLDRLRSAGPAGAVPDRLAQRVLGAALDWAGRARAQRALREKRRLLLASVRRTLRRRLGSCGEPVFSPGAETVLVPLPPGAHSGELARAAASRELRVLDARACGRPGASPDFLVLDLTRHEEGDLLEGIRQLGEIVDARTGARTPARPDPD